MRVIERAPLLTEGDVTYLRYLLDLRERLRDKILGVVATEGDPSSLNRVLQKVEAKLRTRGVRVDTFAHLRQDK